MPIPRFIFNYNQLLIFELFQEWGFDFYYISSGVSVHREEGFFDIDVFAASDSEAILIAVKTRLNQEDVDEHLHRLAKFKRLMPRFKDVKGFGAVAAMIVPDEVASYTLNGLELNFLKMPKSFISNGFQSFSKKFIF